MCEPQPDNYNRVRDISDRERDHLSEAYQDRMNHLAANLGPAGKSVRKSGAKDEKQTFKPVQKTGIVNRPDDNALQRMR